MPKCGGIFSRRKSSFPMDFYTRKTRSFLEFGSCEMRNINSTCLNFHASCYEMITSSIWKILLNFGNFLDEFLLFSPSAKGFDILVMLVRGKCKNSVLLSAMQREFGLIGIKVEETVKLPFATQASYLILLCLMLSMMIRWF